MRGPRQLWILCLLPALSAQQLDTGNFASGRRGASLADRAESAAERKDFLSLEKARDPANRRRLAEEFISRYPRSWLLAGAYQVAATASLQLKDYRGLLEDGRRSLRLLPENAPLLIALAQVEAAQGQRIAALRDAEDALLWLSVFAAPAGVKASEWGPTRRSLEDFARGLIATSGARRLPPWAGVTERAAMAPVLHYAGSEACAKCHRAVYDSWRATGMGAMLRPVREATLLADFSHVTEFRDAAGRLLARMAGGPAPYFEFDAAGGWKRFRVDYTLGSKWQQAYATRLEDGRLFVFPIQFSGIQKRWLNYWATIDPPGSPRADVARFPELSPATSYQRNCAVCHTSQLRLARLDDASMEHATFREPGIDCEMCHGPSREHAGSMQTSGAARSAPGDPPFRFSGLDHFRGTMICGQCHRQSALRELGPRGEMNFTRTPPHFSWLLSQPLAEFGSRAFYKDGRFRETTFIGEAFMRSACFRRGSAQCASCHLPHPASPGQNRTSLKFPADPDRMCLECHTALIPRLARHTHHPASSPGSRCVACHMPPIMNSLMFRAASHEIEIPRADLTARFGQRASPNACLLCHTERDAQWAAAQLAAW